MWSHFFICGCPRSGTSALRNVFSYDPRFAIGMERYYYKAAHNFALKKNLFEKERFFSLLEGDTFWQELSMYGEMQNTFESSVYRGDKIPKLYNHFENLFKEIPNTKVLFIIRDIFDVAASYNVRAADINDKNWSREQNYKVAIDDWNTSLDALYHFFYEIKNDITPIFYEDFFSNYDSIEILYDQLGIPSPCEAKDNFRPFVEKYNSLKKRKNTLALTESERNYINKNANCKLYIRIKKLCLLEKKL